jgi:hypothetical protein
VGHLPEQVVKIILAAWCIYLLGNVGTANRRRAFTTFIVLCKIDFDAA